MSENTAVNETISDADIEHKKEMFEKSFKILSEFETADEIAEFFEQQGIKATRGSATSCAISEYVKGNLGL